MSEENWRNYRRELTEAAQRGKAEGRWTMQEHQLFIHGLKIHGKNWKRLEDYVGTRTSSQIRSHAQKFFNKLIKEGADLSKYTSDYMKISELKGIVSRYDNQVSDYRSNPNEELKQIEVSLSKLSDIGQNSKFSSDIKYFDESSYEPEIRVKFTKKSDQIKQEINLTNVKEENIEASYDKVSN